MVNMVSAVAEEAFKYSEIGNHYANQASNKCPKRFLPQSTPESKLPDLLLMNCIIGTKGLIPLATVSALHLQQLVDEGR